MHQLYHFTVVCFGNLEAIASSSAVWSAGLTTVFEMCVVALVQGFYLRRIWILSKRSYVLLTIMGPLLFVRISFGLGTAALCFALDAAQFRTQFGPMFTTYSSLILSALVDLVVTVTLVYYLREGRTGIRSTDNMIKALMAYAVNTGAITMAASLATLLTFTLLKTSLLYGGLSLMTGKLYANSFLGTLNARSIIWSKSQADSGTTPRSTELSNLERIVPTSGPVRVERHIQIFQETTKVTDASDTTDEDYSSLRSKTGVALTGQDSE